MWPAKATWSSKSAPDGELRDFAGGPKLGGSLFCPTGKSLLVDGNRVKLKIMKNQKYFCFTELKKLLGHMHPVPLRGALHDRHERGMGRGGRGGADNGRC